MYSTEIEINPADVDNAYRHVHHATCVRYLETARSEILNSISYPLDHLLEMGFFFVITGISVRYLREVTGGTIRIACENPSLEGKTLKLEQKMFNHRGKLAIEASIESKFVCTKRKRAVLPPEEFLEAFFGAAK